MDYKEEMINKFINKHGYKFDYSKVVYKNNKTNIKIICPMHGLFEQTPKRHLLSNTGCHLCTNELKRIENSSNTKEFIEKSKLIWGEKYDYSKVNYINALSKVIIILDGIEYLQVPCSHLSRKAPENKDTKKTTEEFAKEANIVHNNKYDYSITNYITSNDHIEFMYNGVVYSQIAIEHLRGHQPDNKITPDKYIKMCADKFNSKFEYPYLNTELININSKITILCKIHGISTQTAYIHYNSKCGCKHCVDNSSKGELKIMSVLGQLNISYIPQYKFDECKKILKLPFDFYLPAYNMCIEYDGYQHFNEIQHFGGEKALKELKINDSIKNDFCLKNNIKLLRIAYYDYMNIESIIKTHLI